MAASNVAAELFQQAEAAFNNQEYERAAQLFEGADREAPHASVVYNAAVSWDHAQRRARAAQAYQRALQRDDLDPAQARDAEQRLAALGEELGYLQVTKPVGAFVSVAHAQRMPIPAGIYLEPGEYEVIAEDATGKRASRRINVARRRRMRLDLSAALPAPSQPEPAPALPPEPATPQPPETSANDTQAIIGWVMVGVGVVAAGTATYLGLRALSAKERYEESGFTSRGAYDEAVDFRLGSNVAWGGAAAFGATGLVLVFTAPTVRF